MKKLLFCFCALFFLHCTEVPDYGSLKVKAYPADGGKIYKSPSGSEYKEGTVVTLTAEAAPGYVFAGWSGNVPATNATKTTITIDDDYTVTANFTRGPDTPTSISATLYDGSVIVEWSSVSNATGYRIYRSTSSSSGYTQIGTSTTTSYTDDNVNPGTQYYYKVSALSNGMESSLSDFYASATLLSAPTGLKVTIGTSSINVEWSSVTSATGYRIYRSTNSSSGYSQIGSSSTPSYTDRTANQGTTYYYEVSAYNSSGESPRSSYASAIALNAPTGVIATASNTASSIAIQWSSVSNATGYRIYRSTSSSGSYTYVGSSSATSYTDTGLSPGATYYYRVSAQNSSGLESPQSSSVYATTYTMNAPSNVKAKADAEECGIIITWSSVPNATEYRIYRNTSSSGTYSDLDYVYADDELSYTDYDFDESSANKTFYYKVGAYNEDTDEERQSNSVSAKYVCNYY